MRLKRSFALWLPLALVGLPAVRIPWAELTEADWSYGLATRFAQVEGHAVHYPTPPAELARLLEARGDAGALRELAEARAALGDPKGALAAMEQWAGREGAAAWAETARWAAARQQLPAAFQAAERALPGLAPEPRRALADERILWAQQHPDLADPIALLQARAEGFPQDSPALEAWLRALEQAGRLQDADAGLAKAQALDPERRLLLRSDLAADHGDARGAYGILDAAVAEPWSPDLRRAFALRVDQAAASAPEAWRATLAAGFDAGALVRLASYFQGQDRPEAAAGLLRQMERRYESRWTRPEFRLLARLHSELDAAPEAFRATLAGAQLGTAAEQLEDLAALGRLALRAGGRPLAWGSYNDEAYHWVAGLDRTPGFWTGSVAFLLTGQDWKEALARLESESLPDRTFATAQALASELARRAPRHPELPALRLALMERHVERGEGPAALALLPLLEAAGGALADEGRRVALLAARQTPVALAEEVRLLQARLQFKAPAGTLPVLEPTRDPQGFEGEFRPGGAGVRAWARPARTPRVPSYGQVLEEGLGRLEQRDPSHLASLGLMLGEMDRLPAAEHLWLMLAARLENWNLDDELGPRYDRALKQFQGEGIWSRAARWYAKRNQHAELRRLAAELANRFRGAAIFETARDAGQVRVELPDQPAVAGRVRLVLWADWIRLKALERFPHSPTVVAEAGRLLPFSQLHAKPDSAEPLIPKVVVADELLEARRWAILFVDAPRREAYFAEHMRKGTLEARLEALEQQAEPDPVADLLLFEGWARLSRFERAAQPGDRLNARYPGDGPLALRLLSLHRSLNGLGAGHAAAAHALVARSAPALQDPAPLWTDLGELEEESSRPQAALAAWDHLVAPEPRNPHRIAELATLLWDYGHDAEALAVVEAGRKRLDRPRFFAFETGVLRENRQDLQGAVREYLEAARPERNEGYESSFEQDQRSLRRLAQLLSRDRVYRQVAERIRALAPGAAADEKTLAAFLPLATLRPPVPGLPWDADAWIDELDLPVDAVGRQQREDRKAVDRPREYTAIQRLGDDLLAQAQAMLPKATDRAFVEVLERWAEPLIQGRWSPDRILGFQDAALARKAALAPSPEQAIQLEVERARFLVAKGRPEAADAVWAGLDARIGSLPEGATRLRAEAERARYLERAKGSAVATAEWQRITARHPWSLGLLEDQVAFLNRSGQGPAARTALEAAVARAGGGHREALLERLTRDSLAAGDLPRSRRAVEKLLESPALDDTQRLAAVHLLGRLNLQENPGWQPLALAQAQAATLKPERQPEVYAELARAADLERAGGAALGLWIEALNRRTERDWLQAAGRSAAKSGRSTELLGFFEQQRIRSPRDVRWAVAVRDLRRAFHQVEGALEAAKAAVAIRPEREQLWREAADLLIRADRVREAADFLDGWNRPRPADEGVAHWRGALYAQVGDGDRALALERAALAAFAREAPGNRGELAERKARAIGRLLDYGLPTLALALASPKGDLSDLAPRLTAERQCALALLTQQFPRLLGLRAGDPAFLQEAARFMEAQGRPEVKEQVLSWLVNRIHPAAQARPNPQTLEAWWAFTTGAGLEAPLRQALAQRLLAQRPGPWQTQAPLAFTERVGADYLGQAQGFGGGTVRVFREPDLARLWSQDLARRDRPEALLAFLEPRWQELVAQVQAATPLSPQSPRLAWAGWLDDPAVLQTWARAAAEHPEKQRELAELMGTRGRWDRFWALAARGWQAAPLVALLAPEPRLAWFRYWEPQASEPVLRARMATVEQVSAALGRLLTGEPEAAADPLIQRLRGPRTVGDLLSRDPAWTWPEFAPRPTAQGALAETGDDRMIGRGVDQGRLPGALWGERPGEAWYVLETLARYRQKDPSAALLPLEGSGGGATERSLLALRLARAQGRLDLALELEANHPGPAQDFRWLEQRLTLRVAAGQREAARELLQAYLRTGQAKLTETAFLSLAALADPLGLPAPLELLDPQQPVGPVLLAAFRDTGGDRANRFHTLDPVGYRIALANRWQEREAQLSAEQVRHWLRELWVTDSASLPTRGLARLGVPWPHAGPWLSRQPVPERAAALKALEAALDRGSAAPALFAQLARKTPDAPADDVNALLALRLRLARGETPQALALVEELVAGLRRGEALGLPGPAMESEPDPDAAAEPTPALEAGGDALVARLQAWLQPWGTGPKAQPVAAQFLRLLQERRAAGPASLAAWTLAFKLTPAADRPALAQDLDQAWFRGELGPEDCGFLAEALATTLPAEVPRWLARWPQRFSYGFAQTCNRARILARIQDPAGAAQALFASRRRGCWQTPEELQGFDLWRRLGAPATPAEKTPARWSAALPFWNPRAEAPGAALKARLQAHPLDALAARAALGSPAPADEDLLFRVGLATGEAPPLLRLKAARGLLPRSWRAAATALGPQSPDSLLRLGTERRFKTAELNLALADLARLASKAGDESGLRSALELLRQRKAAGLPALRAELAQDRPPGPESYQLVQGRPAPIRPRDLTWQHLATLLKAEGIR